MRLPKLMMAAALVSLSTAPAIAQTAAPAGKLSVAQGKSVRAATPAKGSKLAGLSPIVYVVIAIAIAATVLIVTDDEPDSP